MWNVPLKILRPTTPASDFHLHQPWNNCTLKKHFSTFTIPQFRLFREHFLWRHRFVKRNWRELSACMHFIAFFPLGGWAERFRDTAGVKVASKRRLSGTGRAILSGSSGQDLLTVNTLKAGKRYWEKKLDTCTSLGVAHSPGFIFCPSADMVTNSFFSCCLFVNKSYICLEGKLMILHQGGGYGSLSFLLATPSSRTLEGLLGGLF